MGIKDWMLDRGMQRAENRAAKGVKHNHDYGMGCDFACPVWKAKDKAAMWYLKQKRSKQ